MASDHNEFYDYSFYSGAQRELKARLKTGQLNGRIKVLEKFIEKHLRGIQSICSDPSDKALVEPAIRDVYIQRCSLNYSSTQLSVLPAHLEIPIELFPQPAPSRGQVSQPIRISSRQVIEFRTV